MSIGEARQRARETGDLAPLIKLIPYAVWIGINARLREDGSVQVNLPFRTMLVGNPALPAVHGGVIASFMENAALFDLLLRIDEHRIPKSVDFSIDYLRAAHPVECHASCEIERMGRRVAQAQIRCWQDDPAKPIALARAHFLLARPE